jgi:DNA modification methylase
MRRGDAMNGPFGVDMFGESLAPKPSGVVAARFIMPPFSVLDARSGAWQDRKRAWLSTGIRGEVGRACHGSCAWGDLSEHPRSAESTRKIASVGDGATVFDPVLCELAYRWFCPPAGLVLDPFAGGSVRGLVAGALGRGYYGIDLRAEQVAANEEQAEAIATAVCPAWVCADSASALASAPPADFVFSCPPYGSLERYSDDERDLSAMTEERFVEAYRTIVAAACARLRADRFACFVVGDYRDTRGAYRDFVGTTVGAFRNAGLALYNEAALVTAVGSASMRVSKQFAAGRKLCKTHQNVLVFVKGDWRKAAAACEDMSA